MQARLLGFSIFLPVFLSQVCGAAPDPNALIDMQAFDFSIRYELRYGTAANPAKQKIYESPKCALRRRVAEALARVQSGLKLAGGGLKVFDCYRPVAVQERIWDAISDKVLAEDPREGGYHSRGIAVDVTLLNKTGSELEMPSLYGVSPGVLHGKQAEKASANYRRLVELMRVEGFVPVNELWWHFVYQDGKEYPLETVPLSAVK